MHLKKVAAYSPQITVLGTCGRTPVTWAHRVTRTDRIATVCKKVARARALRFSSDLPPSARPVPSQPTALSSRLASASETLALDGVFARATPPRRDRPRSNAAAVTRALALGLVLLVAPARWQPSLTLERPPGLRGPFSEKISCLLSEYKPQTKTSITPLFITMKFAFKNSLMNIEKQPGLTGPLGLQCYANLFVFLGLTYLIPLISRHFYFPLTLCHS